jgi:outer membrane lipoprotein-sorting protein
MECVLTPKIPLQCILSISLLPLSWAWAATEQPVSVDQLQKALSAYQSIEQLDVDFKQTKTLKDIQLDLKSEGHLTLKLPDLVVWKILKPQPMTVDLDQQKITIHSPSSTQTFEQSQNPSAKDRRSFATMLTWLKLDAGAIAAKYSVTEPAPRHYRFVSKDPHEPMLKSLEMEMTAAGHVAELTFEEVSGDQIHLHFGKPTVTYRAKK